MDAEALQHRLRAIFAEELEEHHDVLVDLLGDDAAIGDDGDDARVARLFRSAHTLKGAARSVGLEAIADLCHRAEHLLASVRAGERRLDGDLRDALIGWTHTLDGARRALSTGVEPNAETIAGTAAALATVARSADAAILEPDAAPPTTAPPKTPSPPAATAATTAAPTTTTTTTSASTTRFASSVRLHTPELDALDASAGRLIGARQRSRDRLRDVDALHQEFDALRLAFDRAAASLRGSPGHDDSPRLAFDRRARRTFDRVRGAFDRYERRLDATRTLLRSDARRLTRAVDELERAVRSARLVTFAEACIGLERTIDDAAGQMGVDARFVLVGHDVALDRAVVARLNTPLQHLVRNAIAHGIEPPAERVAAGRDPVGTITVHATTLGTRMRVRVEDDGRGIDVDRILARGRATGLSIPDGDPTRAAIALLFEPGFTTRDAVDAVAGRGVGLDVVRAEIEAMQGTVEMTSQPGAGTCFVIELPTTMTTCATLFVRSCGQVWGIPSSAVERIIRLADVRHTDDGSIEVDDVALPLIDTPAALGLPPERAHPTIAVVVHTAGRSAALVVDEVVGEDEIIIKPLGARFDGIDRVDAAVRRTDGSLAFLLRVQTLVQSRSRHRPLQVDRRPATPHATRRLLVVDDSLTVRALIRSILEEAGYDVTVAVDGASALDVLQTRPIDLVVSDLEMPRVDGIALTRAIRDSPDIAHLPVVLLTGRDDKQAIESGLEAGVDRILTKNTFDQTELLACIDQLLTPDHGPDRGHEPGG